MKLRQRMSLIYLLYSEIFTFFLSEICNQIDCIANIPFETAQYTSYSQVLSRMHGTSACSHYHSPSSLDFHQNPSQTQHCHHFSTNIWKVNKILEAGNHHKRPQMFQMSLHKSKCTCCQGKEPSLVDPGVQTGEALSKNWKHYLKKNQELHNNIKIVWTKLSMKESEEPTVSNLLKKFPSHKIDLTY